LPSYGCMLIRSLLLCTLLCTSHSRCGVLAQFQMQFGTVDVELFEKDKPETVRNFLAYYDTGKWSPNIMHRWVVNFVIQGGSYEYLGPKQVAPIPSFAPVTNEFSVGTTLSNVFGTIAMARVGGQTNSATSSWFFNVKDNTSLDTVDGGFTVFGKTLRGTNVLDLFRYPPGTPGKTNLWFYQNQSGQISEVPAYLTNNVDDYVWVNIRVLKTTIARVAGGNRISWGSVAGLTNLVEFSRQVPALWESADAVIGTGETLSITNDPGSEVLRHYRVRIIYPPQPN
jgi:cyclophilin family peptidyl-prolyl cis-trans isomerase